MQKKFNKPIGNKIMRFFSKDNFFAFHPVDIAGMNHLAPAATQTDI